MKQLSIAYVYPSSSSSPASLCIKIMIQSSRKTPSLIREAFQKKKKSHSVICSSLLFTTITLIPPAVVANPCYPLHFSSSTPSDSVILLHFQNVVDHTFLAAQALVLLSTPT